MHRPNTRSLRLDYASVRTQANQQQARFECRVGEDRLRVIRLRTPMEGCHLALLVECPGEIGVQLDRRLLPLLQSMRAYVGNVPATWEVYLGPMDASWLSVAAAFFSDSGVWMEDARLKGARGTYGVIVVKDGAPVLRLTGLGLACM